MGTIAMTVFAASRSGTQLTRIVPTTTDTYTFANDGTTKLLVVKTGAGACNVTVVTPNNVDGNAIADKVVVVAATTGDMAIGPFPTRDYNDVNGNVSVTFSEATGLTACAVRG